MQVIIPALQRFAYVTAETHSVHDIMRLTEQLSAIQAWRGDLRSIPFMLRRTPTTISAPNPKTGERNRRISHLLSIEPTPEWSSLQLSGMSEAALEIPVSQGELTATEVPLLTTSEPVDDGAWREAPAQPPAQQPQQPTLATRAAKNTIHALGNAYSDNPAAWDELRHEQVQKAFKVDSLEKINAEQAERYIYNLEERVRASCRVFIESLNIDGDYVTEIIQTYDGNSAMLDEVAGVPLSKVLVDLKLKSSSKADDGPPF